MQFVLKEIEKELGFTFPADITVFSKREGDLSVCYDGVTLQVGYAQVRQLFRAAMLCKCNGFEKPFCVQEKTSFEDITFMADCSRNAVYHVEGIKKLLRILAACGYTSLMLYIEETYEVDGEPCFGYLRGRYTKAELKEMVAYSDALGIELIPCMQTLGHLERITKYRSYKGFFDMDNILFVGEEKVYTLIEHMFASLRECFTTKKIHIGMDEANRLGLGEYLKKHGLRDRFDIMTEHLKRVCELAKKYDFSPNMWSDMFFHIAKTEPGAANYEGGEYSDKVVFPQKLYDNLPENISLTYWEYGSTWQENYERKIAVHQKLNRPVWFAGCSWKWGGMLPSNTLSVEAQRASLHACQKRGVTHVINTAWGDDGAETALFAILPAILSFGLFCYDYSDADFHAQFLPLTDYTWDDFMKLEYPNTYGELCVKACHTTKVALYNDPFLGVMDADLNPERFKESFLENANLLRAVPKGKYAYLFDFAAALSEAVYAKYDLGIRLRKAYAEQDRPTLALLAQEMGVAREKVIALHAAFQKQWYTEAKPHGFDVQDIRLGGLIQRLASCKARIEGYLDGTFASIPELEEVILPGTITESGETFFMPSYTRVVTPNIL